MNLHSIVIYDIENQALIDLYGKLAEAEKEIAAGAEGEDFLAFAKKLRNNVHGYIQD